MSKLVTALCVLGLFSVVGCSGDDDNGGGSTATPEAACKSFAAAMCAKFYGCFTKEELDAVRALGALPVGNNEADCRTGWEQEECSAEDVKCDSGTTFSSGNASECLSQFKALSCDELKSGADSPAACDAICE